MTNRPSIFHRKWIVNPKFQYEWMIYFSIGVAMLFAIVYFGAAAAFTGVYKLCTDYAGENADACRVMVDSQRRMLDWAFALGGVMSIIFIFLGAAIVSNRVAGPLFRTVKYLDEVDRGLNPPPLSFRKDDHYADLATAVNRLTAKLKGR